MQSHNVHTHTLSEPTDKKLRTLVCEVKMVTMLAISICELGLTVLKFCVVLFFFSKQDRTSGLLGNSIPLKVERHLAYKINLETDEENKASLLAGHTRAATFNRLELTAVCKLCFFLLHFIRRGDSCSPGWLKLTM